MDARGPDAPTVLLYAHHDVQPPGIVENWSSDPFEPPNATAASTGAAAPTTRRAQSRTRPRSRRGCDTAGALPCNVRVLIEGEEEIGSPTLHRFLTAHLDELRSDVLVLADAGNWKVGVPGLTYSLRGLAAADIELRALDGPLHSGMAGGAVPDPVMALARLLASLVDEHGDVAIDGVLGRRAPTGDERAGADRRASTTTRTRFARAMGVRPGVELVGDPAVTAARTAVVPPVAHGDRDRRPSDQGLVEPDRGPRPRRAVSLRLAPGQDPDRVLDAAARARRSARAVGSRARRSRRSKARPRGRPSPNGPAFDAATARAARRGSASSRC